MALDGGVSGLGFPVPLDPNMTDPDKLEEMQRQFVASLEGTAQELGLNPEQVRADAEQLAPFQPMMDFVEKWRGEDGLWAGDPIQRSQEYMGALTEVGQRMMGGMFSTLMFASEQPPWDNPDTLSILQGLAEAEGFADAATGSDGKLDGYRPETLPDGTVGYVSGLDPFWVQTHLDWVQGNEVPGFEGTCGPTSVANIAKMYGMEVTEGSVVQLAVENDLCNAGYGDPEVNGGSRPAQNAELLGILGIPARVEQGRSLDDIAAYVEQGRGVELGVNAGLLWNDPAYYRDGRSNHAIALTNAVRDGSGELVGFEVCDSGKHDAPLDFVPADVMQRAFAEIGGECVVVDIPRTQGYPPGTSQGQFA